MTSKREVIPDQNLLEQTLALAGVEMILVGGQALAFWAHHYELEVPATTVTKDIDLLGTRDDVQRLANGLQAQTVFPRKQELTLLVGQIKKDIGGDEYLSIDVLKGVYGSTHKSVEARAVHAANALGPFRVLHPIDLLQGRLENTHKLADKEDEHALAQLRLGVDVGRAFLIDIASNAVTQAADASRPIVLRHIGRIESMALSDAGRKVAKRYGIHVADAIEPGLVIHIDSFTKKKLPQLLNLMSARRRKDW